MSDKSDLSVQMWTEEKCWRCRSDVLPRWIVTCAAAV